MFNKKIEESTAVVDYARLIESFRKHDKGGNGVLTLMQYKKLLKDMKILKSDDFATITYNALSDESKDGITFDGARIICEASAPNQSKKSKLNSLIFFRGVDTDKDGRVNEDQFRIIAQMVDKDLKDNDLANLFNSCAPDDELRRA